MMKTWGRSAHSSQQSGIRILSRSTGDHYLGRAEISSLLVTLCLNSWLFWKLAPVVFPYIWEIFPQKILSELVYFWRGWALMRRHLAEYWAWELLLSHCTLPRVFVFSQCSDSTANRLGERKILEDFRRLMRKMLSILGKGHARLGCQ